MYPQYDFIFIFDICKIDLILCQYILWVMNFLGFRENVKTMNLHLHKNCQFHSNHKNVMPTKINVFTVIASAKTMIIILII